MRSSERRLVTYADGSRDGGFSSASVCLFIRTRYQTPTQLAYIENHQTWYRNVLRWHLKTRLFWGLKVENQCLEAEENNSVSVSMFRDNAIGLMPLAAYVSYGGGGSPLQCPAAQSMLATPGFHSVTSPLPILQPTAGFSVRGVFRSEPASKTLPVWVVTLLRVLASSSSQCIE